MKFAIGYQLSEEGEEPFINIVRNFKDSVEEIYFSWLNLPSGRMPLTGRRGIIDWDGQKQLIDVRASVNMRIGTVKGMQYVTEFFDSFYLQREYNRDFTRIKEVKEWCNSHNKGLY